MQGKKPGLPHRFAKDVSGMRWGMRHRMEKQADRDAIGKRGHTLCCQHEFGKHSRFINCQFIATAYGNSPSSAWSICPKFLLKNTCAQLVGCCTGQLSIIQHIWKMFFSILCFLDSHYIFLMTYLHLPHLCPVLSMSLSLKNWLSSGP